MDHDPLASTETTTPSNDLSLRDSPPVPVDLTSAASQDAATADATIQPSATPTPPPTTIPPTTTRPRRFGGKRRLAVTLAIVVVILGLASAAVFGLYLPNTPDGVFATSLRRTGMGVDQLVAYSMREEQTASKGATFSGSVHVKSSEGEVNAALSGGADTDSNASLNLQVTQGSVSGSAALRAVHVPGATSPDVYLQLTHLSQFADQFGLGEIATTLEGRWISVDHNLVDEYVKRAAAADSSNQSNTTLPSSAQLNDAIRRIQTLNKQYIFTTDSNKAVLKKLSYVGQDKVEGRSANHYIVGYDKSHLITYLDLAQHQLDASTLNDWAMQTADKSASQLLNINDLRAHVANLESGYQFGLWADTQMKFISKLHIADTSGSGQSADIMPSVGSDSTYTVHMLLGEQKDDSQKQLADVTLTLNTKTGQRSLRGNADSDGASVDFHIDETPSSQTIHVVAPTSARPLTDILHSLGLDVLLPGALST